MSATATVLLGVTDLHVGYVRGKNVLSGVSFEVRRGEVFGLLGPNGSGKSTTFSVLTGLLVPEKVQLTFDGQPVQPGAAALRRRLGVVFQKPSLDPNLSGRENLMLSAALHSIPKAEARTRVERLLDFADLSNRADDIVKKLSGGMRRRLELARALVHDPDLLLMDEPTTGLDEASYQRTWQRLHALRAERGLTILLSTHRPEEAGQCDRIALIDQGGVVASDTPANLLSRVSGDVLTVLATDAEALIPELTAQFGVTPVRIEGGLEFACEAGHSLIPRLVEAFPRGRLSAVSLKRPGLAEVFLKLTGRALGGEEV